jgi:hypothetical protein
MAPACICAAAFGVMGATPPPTIFDSYHVALAARKTPANMEFDYTVTRSSPDRIVTEQHRVYWSASGVERNDTIAINGTNLVPPRSRLLHRSDWPYDVGQFVASGDDYNATVEGVATVANRKAYVLRLARAAQADFMLTGLYVDAATRLPLRQTFDVTGADCQGSGSIDFLPAGEYWLPSFVSVVCTGTAAAGSPAPIFKEAIRFSGYHFPAAIPSDVFGATQPPSLETPATSSAPGTSP